MMGIYVIVGASLLGAVSCLLIAWSLWTRSQARRRAKQGALPPEQGAAPPQGLGWGPAPPGYQQAGAEPRTEFMSEDQLFASAPATRPTMVLTDDPAASEADEHELRTEFMTEEELFAEEQAEQEEDEHELRTEFMTEEELFAEEQAEQEDDEHELRTAFMTEEELFAEEQAEQEEDEHELPTQFLTDEELFAEQEEDEHELPTQFLRSEDLADSLHGGASASGEFRISDGRAFDSDRLPASDRTIVLPEESILDEGAAGDESEWVQPEDGFAVAPPKHQHLDRPPVHRIPIPPPGASGPAPVQKPAAKPTIPAPVQKPAAKPTIPAPAKPAARARPAVTPKPKPKPTPPSRLPPARAVAKPPPRAPVRPSPARPVIESGEDVPQRVVQATSQGHVGFVGAPLDDDDDDDDDFDDDNDPETELVHQAELLRLMTQTGGHKKQ
jgi:hypothetical protein